MRGGYIHNDILVEQPACALEKLGARVFREYPIRRGRCPQYMDLYAELDHYRIALEGEQKPWRVCHDVLKAEALQAHMLFIVVPTGQVARAACRQLNRLLNEKGSRRIRIVVLPLGAALQLLSNKSLLMSVLNVRQTLIHQISALTSNGNKRGRL